MAKKGQTFNRYDEATKAEAVRLRVEEQWSYSMIMDKRAEPVVGVRPRFQLFQLSVPNAMFFWMNPDTRCIYSDSGFRVTRPLT